MGYYLTIGGEDEVPVASVRGWSDFCKWASGIDAPLVAHLIAHGWAQDLGAFESQLAAALKSSPPDDKTVADTITGILQSLSQRSPDAESIVLTDGFGQDDGKEGQWVAESELPPDTQAVYRAAAEILREGYP